MTDLPKNINEKPSNLVSRNTPVALVVGAAGFIGSHLAEALLEKNIQVLGVDNFKTGKKEYLQEAVKNNKFHLIEGSASSLPDLSLPRLDYIFIAVGEHFSPHQLLGLAKQFNSKIVFISSIELYDKNHVHPWLKDLERELASYAAENNLNARILRLAAIFGPRMHFHFPDPINRLIKASLRGELQSEFISGEFSSRAIYISDAVDLIIKSMFAGSTAQKIFDGALPSPIKVDDIKQILLDPIWHESRGFNLTELPPWSTPNLEKTMKFLSWQPKEDLIKALKETLTYFKDNEINVSDIRYQISDIRGKDQEKQKLMEEWKSEPKERLNKPKNFKMPKIKLSFFVHLAIIAAIFYTIIYPAVSLTYGVFSFKSNLEEAVDNLSKGRFGEALLNIDRAENGLKIAQELKTSVEFLGKISFLEEVFVSAEQTLDLSKQLTSGARDITLGMQSLYDGLLSITGEKVDPPGAFLDQARVNLTSGEEGLTKIYLSLEDSSYGGLKQKINSYLGVVKKAKAISLILPKIAAIDAKKSYLILLQNNMELRPTGGFIGSLGRADFEGGKLKKIEVQDIYALDGGLNLPVEPPADLKIDLGVNNWYLRDSNWEPDFPTSARQAQWFYNKETGSRVDGVVSLDLTGAADLLTVLGTLDLKDYQEKIDQNNLFEKSITYAETSFFPGSQAKKNFLNALMSELFNKMFFSGKGNWPGIIASLGKSFETKHLVAYLDDPKLFAYLDSLNFSGVLPRQAAFKVGETDDLLSLVEANLGANKSNFYLDRKLNLETGIGKEGEINHRLRISYTNRSPSEVWPAGKYKNRMRVYLPFGAKVTRVLWGEHDLTKDVKSFSDYGRSGYSFLVELLPKEQKTLVLDWQLANKISFADNQALYRLDIIKQAGTNKDLLEWTLTFPINYKIVTAAGQIAGPQEHRISTDLSTDRRLEVKLTK